MQCGLGKLCKACSASDGAACVGWACAAPQATKLQAKILHESQATAAGFGGQSTTAIFCAHAAQAQGGLICAPIHALGA